ncbi:hypothetical protein ABDK09_18095 [Vibrio sp. CDRSL-10 TSBA]
MDNYMIYNIKDLNKRQRLQETVIPIFEYDGQSYNFKVQGEVVLSLQGSVIKHEEAEKIYLALLKAMELTLSIK